MLMSLSIVGNDKVIISGLLSEDIPEFQFCLKSQWIAFSSASHHKDELLKETEEF